MKGSTLALLAIGGYLAYRAWQSQQTSGATGTAAPANATSCPDPYTLVNGICIPPALPVGGW